MTRERTSSSVVAARAMTSTAIPVPIWRRRAVGERAVDGGLVARDGGIPSGAQCPEVLRHPLHGGEDPFARLAGDHARAGRARQRVVLVDRRAEAVDRHPGDHRVRACGVDRRPQGGVRRVGPLEEGGVARHDRVLEAALHRGEPLAHRVARADALVIAVGDQARVALGAPEQETEDEDDARHRRGRDLRQQTDPALDRQARHDAVQPPDEPACRRRPPARVPPYSTTWTSLTPGPSVAAADT